jgi:hypothetical protein
MNASGLGARRDEEDDDAPTAGSLGGALERAVPQARTGQLEQFDHEVELRRCSTRSAAAAPHIYGATTCCTNCDGSVADPNVLRVRGLLRARGWPRYANTIRPLPGHRTRSPACRGALAPEDSAPTARAEQVAIASISIDESLHWSRYALSCRLAPARCSLGEQRGGGDGRI